MGKLIFLFFFPLILTTNLYGQESAEKKFNRRYIDVNVSLVATDINEAQRVADSLRNVAVSDEQKIKAYLLLAKLAESNGDVKQCVKNLMKADTVANTTLNYSWQATTAGFLATTFRRLGLLKASGNYLSKAEEANEKEQNSQIRRLTRINILHEWAFHSFEAGDFPKGEKFVKKAAVDIRFDSKSNRKLDMKTRLIEATNTQLLGICQLHAGNFDAAGSLLLLSLQKIDGTESNLQPYIYRGLAEVEIGKKNLREAQRYLKLIDPYIASGKLEDLKVQTFGTWAKYYKLSGELEKAIDYTSQASIIKEKRDRLAKQVVDDLMEDFYSIKKTYRGRYTIALILMLLFVTTATAVTLYFYTLPRKYKEKYLRLKETMTKPSLYLADVAERDTVVSERLREEQAELFVDKEVNISKDTEKRLFEELVTQEQAHFFLESGMSLAKLANNLGTNQRYVTYIVLKYRKMHFYDYISSCRVEYIITSIKNNPELLKFKLAHLAEMCGFSSPSKFSTAFKAVTGLPPSAFVHFEKNELDSRQSDSEIDVSGRIL